MKAIPCETAKVEQWRYQGKEWKSLDDTPEEFKSVTFGCFEAFFDGKWRKGRGSYMSDDGPMVWLEDPQAIAEC